MKSVMRMYVPNSTTTTKYRIVKTLSFVALYVSVTGRQHGRDEGNKDRETKGDECERVQLTQTG